LIVERASPVIFETNASPPRPAARTSAAAKSRRPRSSSVEPNFSHRTRIAVASIIKAIYYTPSKPGIPRENNPIHLLAGRALERREPPSSIPD
jgi:hypothetical protein